MNRCPRCAHEKPYRLADGRYKCRSCGLRYSWTSVWDSIRLPVHAKEGLLAGFANGVPAYRHRISKTSAKACERFYRLARACCAYHSDLRERFGPENGAVMLHLYVRENRIRVSPSPRDGAAAAVAKLSLNRDVAVFKDVDLHASASGSACAQVGRFWHVNGQRLNVLHGVRAAYLHLYLGEMVLRHNEPGEDFGALTLRLMKTTAVHEIKSLLAPRGHALPRGSARSAASQ